MRLTTKGRFAVTAMIDVAMHNGEGPVTLAGVADRQKISLSYLEQLFGKLRRHELVSSGELEDLVRQAGDRQHERELEEDLGQVVDGGNARDLAAQERKKIRAAIRADYVGRKKK